MTKVIISYKNIRIDACEQKGVQRGKQDTDKR